jgi:hypothetical protein
MRSVLLSPETKAIIARVYRENPKQKAPQVRLKVWKITHEEDRALPKNWPSLSSIQKELAIIRRKMNEPSPEDMPWTLDTLRDKPLPAEALSKVLQIWLTNQESPSYPVLTIREARWIAQLSSMTEDEDTELLRMMAEICAEWELIGELTNTAQLSEPATMLYVYSRLTRMPEEEEKEHHEAILKEKHPSVAGTRREKTMKGLEAIYGKDVLKTVKPKSKNKKGGTK